MNDVRRQVAKHKDPQDACLAVVVESYKAWLATEARTDDITVIVVEFELGEGLTCVTTILSELGGCRCGRPDV